MHSAAPVVLQGRELHKRFGSVEALSGVSLDLHEGELVGILGPHGAGKSTLLRVLSGSVPPDAGQVGLFGQPLTGPAGPENLAFVPQDPALYPLLSARENLEILARINRVPAEEIKARSDWGLEWAGLTEAAHEPLDRLSTGMKRRLAFAGGVLHGPRIVLLDEPTLGVDAQSRESILEMMAQLRSTGYSLAFTTHRIHEAETRCDRIVIMDGGTVIAAGTLAELSEKTVGTQRMVILKLERPPERPVEGFDQDSSGIYLRAMVRDVAVQLPVLLVRVQAAACRIENVEVHSPSLQSVFIHLTGKDLSG